MILDFIKKHSKAVQLCKKILCTILECVLLFVVSGYFPNVFIRRAYDIPDISFWGNRADMQTVMNYLRQDFDEQRKSEPMLMRSGAALTRNEWDISYYSEQLSLYHWSDSRLGSKTASCSAEEYEQYMRAIDAVLQKDEKSLLMGADAKTSWIAGSGYALVYSQNGRKPTDTCCFKEGESVYCYRLSLHWFICREYTPSTGRDVLCTLAKCVPWLAVSVLLGLKFLFRQFARKQPKMESVAMQDF